MGTYKYIKSDFSDNYNIRTQYIVFTESSIIYNKLSNDVITSKYTIEMNQKTENGYKMLLKNKNKNISITINLIKIGNCSCIVDFYIYENEFCNKKNNMMVDLIKLTSFLFEDSSFCTSQDTDWDININYVYLVSDIKTA